ncbi:hypothetical protein C8R44DRAFT_738424 [Mycena epipterygia]|nr:hypothetical protein C8R44DRAFT_738424 [Mycena epipterygia]
MYRRRPLATTAHPRRPSPPSPPLYITAAQYRRDEDAAAEDGDDDATISSPRGGTRPRVRDVRQADRGDENEDIQLRLADTCTDYEAGLAFKDELFPRSSCRIAEVHKLSMVFDLKSITHAERAGEHRVPAGGVCEPFYLVGPARSEGQGQRQDAAPFPPRGPRRNLRG